jgi:hypothetical protein
MIARLSTMVRTVPCAGLKPCAMLDRVRVAAGPDDMSNAETPVRGYNVLERAPIPRWLEMNPRRGDWSASRIHDAPADTNVPDAPSKRNG